LVADESYASKCVGAAQALNSSCSWLTVSFLGAMSQEDTLMKMHRCDAFLFASNFESYGLAPLEAATIGVPLITTACGVLPALLRENSTIWVDREQGWSQALMHFLSLYPSQQMASSAVENSVFLRSKGVGLLQTEVSRLHLTLQGASKNLLF
jgi:glycosyltransferase involved in cell wall biosynthesis